MRPENKRMRKFLADNGIEATPRRIHAGSLKGCWRIYNASVKWTAELADKINALGFKDLNGKPLSWVSGNGGVFSIFVRGHDAMASRGMSEPENSVYGRE